MPQAATPNAMKSEDDPADEVSKASLPLIAAEAAPVSFETPGSRWTAKDAWKCLGMMLVFTNQCSIINHQSLPDAAWGKRPCRAMLGAPLRFMASIHVRFSEVFPKHMRENQPTTQSSTDFCTCNRFSA